MQTDWIDELRRLLPESTFTDAETLAAHSGDKWHAAALPQAVLKARCTEEVAAAMRLASRYGVPVTPRGAGVGYVGGCVPSRGGLVISTMSMNRILEVNPADGVAVVQPGVLTADLQAAAAAVG